MEIKKKRNEINHHTIKFLVGFIAISLAGFSGYLTGNSIESISASYHEGFWARDIFVGFLFAISALLFSYNGYSDTDMKLSKLAAVAAIGVALFPCKCDVHTEILPGVHAVSAATMFLVLAYFCKTFLGRASQKKHKEAAIRIRIYKICMFGIIASIGILMIDHFTKGMISSWCNRITFYGESAALGFFGVAWLVASRVLPFVTNKKERFRLLGDSANDNEVD